MSRGKSKTGYTQKASSHTLESLLAAVPVEAFVAMVGKSGLPTKDAKELCEKFRELKD